MPDPRETPAMQQFYRFKQRYAGCMLLFRMGDFYETFDADAVAISKLLGLTLTQRQGGIPMAGVPHHQLENYLKRLVAKGVRVAVCDQLIDASQAKGLVPRAVTRVITPGTLVDESLLEGDAPTAVAAVLAYEPLAPARGQRDSQPPPSLALAVADASTGDFVVLSVPATALADELTRRGVREILVTERAENGREQDARTGAVPPGSEVQGIANQPLAPLTSLGIATTPRPAWHFRPQESKDALTQHFAVSTLAGFGLGDSDDATAAMVRAAGALLRYLQETQTLSAQDKVGIPDGLLTRGSLSHLRPPRREEAAQTLVIDAVSLRSLEVERTLRGDAGSAEGTLLSVFSHARAGQGSCRTPMGRRLLREWLVAPARDITEIERRHAAVATLAEDRRLADQLGTLLANVQDVARIGGRIALSRATPRDLVALARSLSQCEALADALANTPALKDTRTALAGVAKDLAPVAAEVTRLCVDDPPAHLREGGLFRDGVDAPLDEARLLQRDAGAWLSGYQARLIAQHALPNLKVGYNKVAGYFIELPEAQARSAPPELKRMQTLRNAERYTTPELRDFEHKVTTADSRALEREKELFLDLCARCATLTSNIHAFASAVARLDALLAFADKARHRAWTRPQMIPTPTLRIRQGRHPVLDESLPGTCVPNDCELGEEVTQSQSHEVTKSEPPSLRHSATPSLALITGPNMAGKSTYIRQVALLTLLAHAGSFVPAESATIGLTDRIFTRIGADDALHAGQSTFMVEMIETANILHHATPHSLVVLDEVGRGTSTLDGLSLAWGIVEHLAGGSHGVTERPSDGGRAKAAAPHNSVTQSLRHSVTGPRTLFATHYHELTDLEDRLPGRVANLHVAVREWPAGGKGKDKETHNSGDAHSEIVFLHRILPGRTDQSYGLHVARLAGIPAPVIARAREVLASLAVHHVGEGVSPANSSHSKRKADTSRIPSPAPGDQLALFKEYLAHPALDALREVKLDAMTPMQAFDALRTLRQLADEA
jgi:DNA mismatch repair protein MutS